MKTMAKNLEEWSSEGTLIEGGASAGNAERRLFECLVGSETRWRDKHEDMGPFENMYRSWSSMEWRSDAQSILFLKGRISQKSWIIWNSQVKQTSG